MEEGMQEFKPAADKTQCRRLMGEAYGNWYWLRRKAKDNKATQAEVVDAILHYRYYRAQLPTMPRETNERGNFIDRDIDADRALGIRKGGDRYYYDFEGLGRDWVQYDTKQDASYFGMWVNLTTRQTFTYAEGDRTLVTCPTLESFRAELEDAARFYGPPPPMAIGYDPETGTVTEFYDKRPEV